MTVFGKNIYQSENYLLGRIHLKNITENYKKNKNLSLGKKTNESESNTISDSSAEKEFKTYKPNDQSIKINDDGSIYCPLDFCPLNYLTAIAAVDYAMRETKPSCGLVKEFKIISKYFFSI